MARFGCCDWGAGGRANGEMRVAGAGPASRGGKVLSWHGAVLTA
eukprot:CAMPEP_0117698678 /NCGR_PEP_ID=MMETSP0804-20121206/29882_1 /TAXON_ID=1074897 /ORGANISM="Tetraselmis astigmatica, Strain CCMP880" /LENGTH=43 /DNA_ID= /DNA_START= /DNA_END= /DNA_ORIENTATION=